MVVFASPPHFSVRRDGTLYGGCHPCI